MLGFSAAAAGSEPPAARAHAVKTMPGTLIGRHSAGEELAGATGGHDPHKDRRPRSTAAPADRPRPSMTRTSAERKPAAPIKPPEPRPASRSTSSCLERLPGGSMRSREMGLQPPRGGTDAHST